MTRIFRNILLTFCVVLFGIGSAFLNWIVIPCINTFYKNKSEKLKKVSSVVQTSWYLLVRLMMLLGIMHIKINTIEKIKNIKNSIVVASHPSYIDVLILIALIPEMTCFSAERFKNNLFMNNIVNALFITKGNSLDEMVTNAKQMLDEGFSILIFPSGIRHKKNEYPKIRKGASFIALNTGKDVVPIKMTSDKDFLQIENSLCDAGDKSPNYDITVKAAINTAEYLEKYADDVLFKKELTKKISNELYL